ncbi:hypothetical protein [Thalassotalea fusca]
MPCHHGSWHGNCLYFSAELQQQQQVDDVEEQRPAFIAKPNELTPLERSFDT